MAGSVTVNAANPGDIGDLEVRNIAANAAVKTLEDLGLITETTGNKKNRSFSYDRYIKMLSS